MNVYVTKNYVCMECSNGIGEDIALKTLQGFYKSLCPACIVRWKSALFDPIIRDQGR